jgi:hypothetical protein
VYSASTQIVIAAGAESEGEMANRAAMGAGDPDGFATTLREVLVKAA